MRLTVKGGRGVFTRRVYKVRIYRDDGTEDTYRGPVLFAGNDGRKLRADVRAWIKRDYPNAGVEYV